VCSIDLSLTSLLFSCLLFSFPFLLFSSLHFSSLLLYSSDLFSSLIIILYLRFVIFESILLLITFPFRLFSSHLFSYLIFFSKCYLFYPFNIANLSKQYSSSLPLLTPFPPSHQILPTLLPLHSYEKGLIQEASPVVLLNQ
jgi:hypothetical protein